MIFFVTFGAGTVISGPSDVGGTCPSGTYKYFQACCCGHGCCWDVCRDANPPDSCIAQVEGAQWIYNSGLGYYQAYVGVGNGKFTFLFPILLIFNL